MAIRNFKFPGVELTQEFVETPVTGVSQLGVVVLGYQQKINTTSFVYSGTDVKVDLGEVPYCTAITGDTVTAKIDGTFINYDTSSDSGYITVTGSTVNGNNSTIVFNASVIGGTAATNAFGNLVPAVNDVVELTGTGTSSAIGLITSISTTGTTVGVVLAEGVISGTTVSRVVFLKEVTGATLEGATIAEDSNGADIMTIAAPVGAKIGGKSTESELAGSEDAPIGCKLYLEYYQNRLALGTIDSKDAIRGTFGSLEGPLAYSLTFAFEAARGNTIDYVCVPANTKDGYENAMDFINRIDTVYSVVPATYDIEAIKGCITEATKISTNPESKVRRVVWYGLDTPNTNIKDQLIATRQLIGSSYRAQAVWGDSPVYDGKSVPTFALAAAAAGMRAYEPSYRPISNLGYSFFSLKELKGLTASDLLALGSEGVWLIANNFEGTPINLKQVTTAVSNNLNKDEESIVANADSIALTLCHVGEDLVGCSNISPALLKSLSDTITAIMDNYLINRTGNAYIGPQLLSWSLDSLYQDEVLLDHIYAVITCEPPKPFNRFVMTLRIV